MFDCTVQLRAEATHMCEQSQRGTSHEEDMKCVNTNVPLPTSTFTHRYCRMPHHTGGERGQDFPGREMEAAGDKHKREIKR